MLVITAQELKSKLASNEPLMVFDIGNRERYEKQHIPGSACAVCNDDTKKSIMPRLPKNIELVIVSDDDEYPRQVAEMMQIMGLKARYLQGGIRSWQWDMKRSESDRNISPGELKEILDTEDYGLSDNGRTETAKSGTPLPLLPPAPFLLDVRERDEFRQWSIEGSTNIPLSELLSKRDLHDNIPKDKKIITICPHGNRSTIAKYFLERYGYNVSSLEGGLNAWSSTLEDVYKEIDISSTSNDNNNEILKLVQIRRIGKGCISYILGSKGEAAVIDPFYPVRYYINKASEIGVKITKVFDTHQHADHISAAKELAEITGAIWYQSHYEQDQLSFSDEKKSAFPLIPKFSPLYDGDIHKIGGSIFRVIHTPGHTNGSISLLVKGYEQNNDTSSADGHHYFGKSLLLFTGDTLFVNGVGRPDLRDNAKEFAAMLYGTLHDRILPIGDNYNNGYNNNIFILPGHFDKNARAGELLSTTLGKVIEDVGLLNLPREEFIDKISSQVMPTPPNYRQIILINKGDIPILDSSQLHEIEMGPNRCSISGVA
jgi:glyoxylase-like metal-dependent hydrolase (beta-lactamase superfamily II)/rhodanese-related sulfurtransferase